MGEGGVEDLTHADAQYRFTAEVGQEASASQFGRSKSHANAEANHIKMFNPHLPGFCLSPTTVPTSPPS